MDLEISCNKDGKNQALIVILEQGSGLEVTAQTGGHACHHPKTEFIQMIAILLDEDFFDHLDNLYGGWFTPGTMKEETVQILEDQIPFFRVDRSKLKDSEEGWIFGLYKQLPAVLIFGNSD